MLKSLVGQGDTELCASGERPVRGPQKLGLVPSAAQRVPGTARDGPFRVLVCERWRLAWEDLGRGHAHPAAPDCRSSCNHSHD